MRVSIRVSAVRMKPAQQKPFRGGGTLQYHKLNPNPPKGWRYSSGMAMSGKGGRWFGQDFG